MASAIRKPWTAAGTTCCIRRGRNRHRVAAGRAGCLRRSDLDACGGLSFCAISATLSFSSTIPKNIFNQEGHALASVYDLGQFIDHDLDLTSDRHSPPRSTSPSRRAIPRSTPIGPALR